MKDMTRADRRRRNACATKKMERLASLWGLDMKLTRKVRGKGNYPEGYMEDMVLPRRFRKSDAEAREFGVLKD